MIGYLRGTVVDSNKETIILDVNGVGYLIHTSKHPTSGENTKYFIHTHVREDQISLFGFETQQEIGLFKMLLSVSGVGPKVAMAIMSASDVNKIFAAVSKADVGFFTSIPGIGKKGAQRIIIELKGKIGSVQDIDLGEDGDDIVEGLMSMGFDRKEIKKVIIKLDPKLTEGEKIKEVIRLLGKR